MTKQNQQADGEVHEEQLLNFLVNVLNGSFDVSFGDNADFEPEDISEVLVGTTADGTSISPLYDRRNDSSSGTNILRLHHLRTQFDLETVSTVGNTLRQEHTLELPTPYARVRNKRKRDTLAVSRLTDGDTATEVPVELLILFDDFGFEIKALYVESKFSDGNCLMLMQARNHAYVVPIIRWGNVVKKEFSEGWSREIEHDLTTEFAGHEWIVEFPVIIDCAYQMGRYDEHGVARHGSAADAPFIDTPRQARQQYSKWSDIEAT